MQSINIKPNWMGAARPFKHTWEGVTNIDQFRWMVRKDTLEHLEMAHRELGARHVRAVGMFDDEMRVLGKDPQNYSNGKRDEYRVNWQMVDYVIDSLLEIGINPVFTTSFMPGEMAAGEKTVFTTKSRISPPKDYSAWEKLVQDSVIHVVERYGIDCVKNWYFEVWNEPNLFNGFWEGSQEDFFKLWQSTYNAIKSVDQELRVGGPSTARAEWVRELIEYGRENHCEPDYMICHIYNNDSQFAPLSPFDGPQEDKMSKSPNFASGVVQGVRTLLDGLGYKGEVMWNEWGSSWRPHEPIRETANEAAFIAKTMGEVSQLADHFAYWCLSDIYDQVGYGSETFHGNYGMLSLQGLRKPSYQAFELLGKLGTKRVDVEGNGLTNLTNAIATKGDHALQVLIYSYSGEVEEAPKKIKVEVNLPQHIEKSKLTLFRINSEENNIISEWNKIGKPAYLSKAQLGALKSKNILKEVDDGVELVVNESGCKVVFEIETPGIAMLIVE